MNPFLTVCENENVPVKTFAAGEAVLKEGDEEDTLLVMISGDVVIKRESVELSSIDYPGALFGEVSILVGGGHTATVTTTEESSFYVIDDGKAFLGEHAELGLHVAYVLASRLKSITYYLTKLEHEFGDQEEEVNLMTDLLGGLMRLKDMEDS